MNRILKQAIRACYSEEAETQVSTAQGTQANPPVVVPSVEALSEEAKSGLSMGRARAQKIVAAEQGIKMADMNDKQTRLDGALEVAQMYDANVWNSYIVGVGEAFLSVDGKAHGNKVSKVHGNYVSELRRVHHRVEFLLAMEDQKAREASLAALVADLKKPGKYKDKIQAIPTVSNAGGSNRGQGATQQATALIKQAQEAGLTTEDIAKAAEAKAKGLDVAATLAAPPKPDKTDTAQEGTTKAEGEEEGEDEETVSSALPNIKAEQVPLPEGLEKTIRTLGQSHYWALALIVANVLKTSDDADFQNIGATMLDTMEGIASQVSPRAGEEPARLATGTNG